MMSSSKKKCGYFYIDDSLHVDTDFALAALVYFEENPDHHIAKILSESGLNPNKEEYKSSINMVENSKVKNAREKIRGFFHFNGKFGLAIAPPIEKNRELLGETSMHCLQKIIRTEKIKTPIEVYFDEGFFPKYNSKKYWAGKGVPSHISIYTEQDSKKIRGIQVADYVAHNSGVRLKASILGKDKMVKAGPSSGYDPDMEIKLSFELWASIRYSMFRGESVNGKSITDDDISDNEMLEAMTFKSTGVVVSDKCNENVKKNAEKIFGTVYMGCIH